MSEENLICCNPAVAVEAVICQSCGMALVPHEKLSMGQHVLCPYCQWRFVYGPSTQHVIRYRLLCPVCGDIIEAVSVLSPGQKLRCETCGKKFVYPDSQADEVEVVGQEQAAGKSKTSSQFIAPLSDCEISAMNVGAIEREPNTKRNVIRRFGSGGLKLPSGKNGGSGARTVDPSVKMLATGFAIAGIALIACLVVTAIVYCKPDERAGEDAFSGSEAKESPTAPRKQRVVSPPQGQPVDMGNPRAISCSKPAVAMPMVVKPRIADVGKVAQPTKGSVSSGSGKVNSSHAAKINEYRCRDSICADWPGSVDNNGACGFAWGEMPRKAEFKVPCSVEYEIDRTPFFDKVKLSYDAKGLFSISFTGDIHAYDDAEGYSGADKQEFLKLILEQQLKDSFGMMMNCAHCSTGLNMLRPSNDGRSIYTITSGDINNGCWVLVRMDLPSVKNPKYTYIVNEGVNTILRRGND